jgi:uncharacterized protein YrrD
MVFLAFPLSSQAQESQKTLLAGRIIDADVYDENRQEIGEVDDLIIRRSGKVKKLTVEFGGFMDIGDKLVALSFKKFSMKNGDVAAEATRQQLEKRPEINYYEEGFRPDYYYRARPYAGRPYHYPPPGYYYGPNTPRQPIEPYEWAFSPARFLASAIMDRRLINEEGEEIGTVKDLVIHRQSNQITKIVIASEEILGKEVHVGLSYKPLGFTAYGLVYDISPGELKDFIYPYEE